MGSAKKLLVAVSIVVVASFIAPSIAVCQETTGDNWPVRATFYSPTQVGSMVLAPGTYDFQLTVGTVARNVVEIYSVDQKRWLGMVMGITDNKQDRSQTSSFTFVDNGVDAPRAIHYWFYPGWSRSIKFVYRNVKAVDTMAEAKATSFQVKE